MVSDFRARLRTLRKRSGEATPAPVSMPIAPLFAGERPVASSQLFYERGESGEGLGELSSLPCGRLRRLRRLWALRLHPDRRGGSGERLARINALIDAELCRRAAVAGGEVGAEEVAAEEKARAKRSSG